LNATASVSGTFVYSPSAGTILNAGAGQTLHVDFTPDDTANYASASKDVMIDVLKAGQAITFDPLPNRFISNSPFTVVATATSSLPVTFTVSGGVCTIVGDVVTLTDPGTCTVTAHQAGDANYNPAPDVSRSFEVELHKVYLPLVTRNGS
jgi:hypothetical protein